MAKIFIVNGSPRKNWNTGKMCESFSQGAQKEGVETEIINLYDIDFKGCRSCFACKLKDGKNFGHCSYPDGLTPILDKISQADGIVFASPIYFGDVTGVMRSFAERLMFPFFRYAEGYPSIAPKKLQTAVIYTMNVPEELCNRMYPDLFNRFEWAVTTTFSQPERITACDTYQFNDYGKYDAECFDAAHKKQQLENQLPKDLQKAYKSGAAMAKRINNLPRN